MAIDASQLRDKAKSLHMAGEAALRRGEHAQTLLMFVPGAGDATVMVLPSGNLPSLDRSRQIASERSTAGLILSGEAWTGQVSVGQRGIEMLPLQDLPQPSALPPAQRGEALVTTAVLAGSNDVVRLMTAIMRSAFGLQLADVSPRNLGAREDSLAGWLHQVLRGEAGFSRST